MYLALRPPWGAGAVSAPALTSAASSTADAGVGKSKPKRHRPRRGAPAEDRGWGEGDAEVEAAPQPVRLSAADRTVEWRGDDTSRPPQKLDMRDDSAARSLDDAEIRSTIDAQSAPVQACVVSAATNTDLTGTITVKLVVEGTGRVAKTKVSAFRYLFERGLLECIRTAVERFRFPATGASTLVTLPIQLH